MSGPLTSRHRPHRVIIAVAVAIAIVSAVAAQDSPEMPDCDALARDDPDNPRSYGCFIEAAKVANDMAGAERRLQALLDIRPEQHWARYHLGIAVTEQRDYDRGLSLIVEAAEGMEADGEHSGAAQARSKVALHLTNLRRYDEATAELDLAEQLAEHTDNDALRARVLVQRGWTALRSGDYAAAALHMRRAERLVFPDGDSLARDEVLGGRGAVAWLTGRFAEAKRFYERQAELLEEEGRIFELATAKTNALGVTDQLAELGKVERDEHERVAREALAAAAAANNFRSMCRAQSALGKILDGEEAIAYALAAVDSARKSDYVLSMRGSAREAAARLAEVAPHRMDEALSLLKQAEPPPYGNPDERIRQLIMAAAVHRSAGTREQTIRAYEKLFDEAEKLRDLQRDDEARAGALAMVVNNYRRLASYLLARETLPSREDLDLVFHTLERMRSRVLLDRLDANGVVGAMAPEGPLAERRLSLLEEISRVQRSLGARDLAEERRAELLNELERVELEEREARAALAEADLRFRALRLPEFPSTEEIEELLEDDQALLSFHVGTVNAGGSWVMVIDRRGVRVHALPPAGQLRSRAAFLLGLIERRDGSERPAATRLGDELLGAAIADLDPGVGRLVVIPDDVLWKLPLDLLRVGGGDAGPLAERFHISLVPSATLWKRWVTRTPETFPVPALALADPDLPWTDDGGDPSTIRSWALERGMTLGRLPRARDEARALTRRLGGGSRLWMAADASEHALKRESLAEYGLLHFATHAVVDESHPARSAVVLASGSTDEDGLLQPREIIDLDLTSRVVLLTACRSASGSVLEGEGPLSLARAFFQAGAHAVVGSLWPLRDDDTAVLMDAFSRHLATGTSVAVALTAARREMIADGAPAAAWAGLVLIGDGSAVPVPGGENPPARWPAVTLVGAVIVGLLALMALARRRPRSVPPTDSISG